MRYVLQKAGKAYCKYCDESIYLLIEEAPFAPGGPVFYICFDCQKIFHVGVGEVEFIISDGVE
jgi:hypothetical protein